MHGSAFFLMVYLFFKKKEILNNYVHLGFHFHQSVNDLIKDKSLLNDEARKYATHPNTHLYTFKKIGNKPVLVIEVDGYKNHKKGTKQYDRDQFRFKRT